MHHSHHTCTSAAIEIPANPSKLGRRHLHNGVILCLLRHLILLAINIHHFYLKIINLTRAFEHEVDGVATVINFGGHNVIIADTFHHLSHVFEVYANGYVVVATVVFETIRPEEKGDDHQACGIPSLDRNSSRSLLR